MTTEAWFEHIQSNQTPLESIIREYHPAAGRSASALTITASRAEVACEIIRENIRTQNPQMDPVKAFNTALAHRDISASFHSGQCRFSSFCFYSNIAGGSNHGP